MKSQYGVAICSAVCLLNFAASSAQSHAQRASRSFPYTSFLFSDSYDPNLAVPTDAVRLYTFSPSWAQKGYNAQAIIHGRFGGNARLKPDDVQTDRDGNPWGVATVELNGSVVTTIVGPIASDLESQLVRKYGRGTKLVVHDYYRVPTEARTQRAGAVYQKAMRNGASGLSFDEPEFWWQTGYSEAFKLEWRARYNEPWQKPHQSVDARYKSERLKAYLFHRHIDGIFTELKRQSPRAERTLILHSPLDYYRSGIVAAHHQLTSIPSVQNVIAEVWTGTARVPVRVDGHPEERTFEMAYLEYSSFYHLIRGSGKRLWFFMDPLEDNPNRTSDDYRNNYVQTVLAALMYPQISRYEVMAWPNRIFGHVPKDYEVVVNTIIGMLCGVWQYPQHHGAAEGGGIGTFIADSMGWQRGDPSPSDFNGFYGLSLPLVMRGVPVQVLSLDRVVEPDYLSGSKVLLLSYDFLKPSGPLVNAALATWVRRGGALLLFGGSDAYNAVADSWWRRAGYKSPVEDLLGRMCLPGQVGGVLGATTPGMSLELTPATAGLLPRKLNISPQYRMTRTQPLPEAAALYRVPDEKVPIVWEAAVGKGTIIFAGVDPGYITSKDEGSSWLRSMCARACQHSGIAYRESSSFFVRRGPYLAVRTLGEPQRVSGRYVDLLSPRLEMVRDPLIRQHNSALLKMVAPYRARPRILAVSGRLSAVRESSSTTTFVTRAPRNTRGIARLLAGMRCPAATRVWSVAGERLDFTLTRSDDTVRVDYPNNPDGVIVIIRWRRAVRRHPTALSHP